MPGRFAGAFAAYAGPQKKPVIDRSLLTEIGDVAVIENQACARKVALAAAIWDSCIHQTVQIGEHITDAGNYAASETSKILGCSKTVADTLAEIGMDLRLRLPAVKAAFEAGELDLARVRAIYRTTSSYSVNAAERAETEILHAARRLSPGPLSTEVNDIMHRIAPEETAELRKDLTALTNVRYRDRDMIATIEANLEAGDAAACWQLINEMAATLCPRDPRTRGQRRAAAYTAIMRRESYLACTCEADNDDPCTANPELPDRRQPLTTVTIDLETLVGLADLPAYLAGHGLIDADYARELSENGDLQLLITEATDLAAALGHPVTPTHNHSNDDENSTDAARTDIAQATGTENTGTTGAEESRTVVASTAPPTRTGSHLTFHPLGRGRRRKGIVFPKRPKFGSAASPASAMPGSSGAYRGSYTLTAALERAISANPALAVALYPDGHGGFIEPPDGALRYRPGASLAECVRQRDRTCRHPGCTVPATNCEIDHVIPYNHHNPRLGGWTILTNLHCLCKYHHSLKTMGAWTPTMLAGAVDYWKSNSGTAAVTLPGNTMGATDHAERSLIPHVPRKQRPACTTNPTTAEPTTAKPTTGPAAGPTTTAQPVTTAPATAASATAASAKAEPAESVEIAVAVLDITPSNGEPQRRTVETPGTKVATQTTTMNSADDDPVPY